jgi:uncharacterized protein YecE (DUF72 family)
MDFGRTKTNLDKIDFSLPADYAGNQEVLVNYFSEKQAAVYVGCPIWGVKEWLGKYYPASAKEKDFLFHYAQQFNTIELNTTHYRIPDAITVRKWKESVTDGFKFCPKIPQIISHDKRLVGAEAETEAFCEAMVGLGDKLGIAFLQLPPFFSATELPALENFLQKFSSQIPLAVEFRNEDFFNTKAAFNRAFEVLEKYKVSPVITDVAGRRDVLHQRLTTDTVLIRWVGETLHPTDYERLDMWIEKLTQWLKQGLKNIYFFVHQTENVTSADLITYLIPKLNERAGLALKPPKLQQVGVQGRLF